MSNLKEVKTTIIGSILFIIGIGILLYEYFTVKEMDWTYYVLPISLGCAGIGFLLAPDKILEFGFGWLSKKVQK